MKRRETASASSSSASSSSSGYPAIPSRRSKRQRTAAPPASTEDLAAEALGKHVPWDGFKALLKEAGIVEDARIPGKDALLTAAAPAVAKLAEKASAAAEFLGKDGVLGEEEIEMFVGLRLVREVSKKSGKLEICGLATSAPGQAVVNSDALALLEDDDEDDGDADPDAGDEEEEEDGEEEAPEPESADATENTENEPKAEDNEDEEEKGEAPKNVVPTSAPVFAAHKDLALDQAGIVKTLKFLFQKVGVGSVEDPEKFLSNKKATHWIQLAIERWIIYVIKEADVVAISRGGPNARLGLTDFSEAISRLSDPLILFK